MPQTLHAREKSTNNEKNHQPPPNSIYSQTYSWQEKSKGRSVQDQKHEPHVKKTEKEDKHGDPVGTHDTNAHRELKYNECRSYD